MSSIASAIFMSMSIVSLAPMPAALPEYDVDCQAGAMTGLAITRVSISVRNEVKGRMGVVRTHTQTFDALVKSYQIPLRESIGGRGFVEDLEFGPDGKRTKMVISVRGEPSNNIMDFQILEPRDDRREFGNYLVGNCALLPEAAIKALVQ